MTATATRPIISGFHPDPSICLVDGTYYLATSSFEYVPGVPIHSSSDLIHWTLIGNALVTPAQLPPNPGTGSAGICAPTLRYHDGKFWLTTMNVHQTRLGQQIVHTENPAGPWSEPVHVPGTIGVDGDLCWDEDGVCHFTWASFMPQLHGIASVPINPETGQALGEPRLLWGGTGMASAEGPHLYRIDGWWYLLLAEGGTERGHSVTVARSRTLDGPWEECPRNPILTHRSTKHPVQNTGHADLVQRSDGTWAMVYLGVRPRGKTPGFHVNGRETFLAGIDWVDGWPVVAEDRFEVPEADHSFTETFATSTLDPRWIGPGIDPRSFATWRGPGKLELARPDDAGAVTALTTRTRDEHWTCEVSLDVTAGTGRLMLRLDQDHWYGLTAGTAGVAATVNIGPAVVDIAQMAVGDPTAVRLRIAASGAVAPNPYLRADQPDLIELAVIGGAGEAQVLGTLDGRYLSTEVAGGFTGRVVGVEVVSGEITVHEVDYRTDAPQASAELPAELAAMAKAAGA